MNVFNLISAVCALLIVPTLGGSAAASAAEAALPSPAATAQAGTPPARWRNVYGESAAELEHLAGVVDPDGDLWLVVGQREDGVLGGPHELQLWHIQGNGQRNIAPFPWDGARPIQSQRPMQMLATRAGIAIAMHTDSGAYVVTHASGSAPVTHGPLTVAGDSALVAMGADASGQPTLVTSRGLVSLDAAGRSWVLRWKKPADALIVTAVASAGGRFGVLTTSVDGQHGDMSLTAIHLAVDGLASTQVAPLAPAGNQPLGKSLVALGNGGFALADPFATEGPDRWRLTTLDANLNLVGSATTDLAGTEVFRARLATWNGALVLVCPTVDNKGVAAFIADDAGQFSRLPLPRDTAPDWQKAIRVDLYPRRGGDAYLVESAHTLDEGARTTRSRVTVTRLHGVVTGDRSRNAGHASQGDQP